MDRAWAGALVLITLIMFFYIVAKLLATASHRRDDPATMSKSITMQDVDIFYGDFKAVEGVSLKVQRQLRDRVHRALGVRQVDRPAHDQPDARGDPAGDVEGRCCSTARTSTARASTRSTSGGPSAWCSSGPTRSRPCPSPRTSWPGVRLAGGRLSKSDAEAIVEESLRGANLWEEVKDRLAKPGSGLSGGQQQRLCIARAIAVKPAGAADGRAVLGAGPDLHAGDRGPHPGARRAVHDHHRDPQHAAGRHGSRTRPASSTSPGWASPAVWSRWARPRRSSPAPRRPPPRTTSPAASADRRLHSARPDRVGFELIVFVEIRQDPIGRPADRT